MFRHVVNRTRGFLMSQISCQYPIKNRTLFCAPRLNTLFSHQRHPRNYQRSTQLDKQQRWFWGLTVAFNQVDPERVRLAGPDRAAAEWILRNGGSIKWKDGRQQLKDYNSLPSSDFQNYKVAEIDLTATDVIGLGFQHLENLKHVQSIKLHGCRSIMDDALANLHFVKDTLRWLEISRCPMITDKGLQNLHVLEKLENLVIYDLIEIRNFDDSISKLQQSMSWVKMNTEDPLLKPENLNKE